MPTAWRFGKGSRIRLAIAGADADHYGQVPHGRPPVFTISRAGCFLDLPLVEKQVAEKVGLGQAEFAILFGPFRHE